MKNLRPKVRSFLYCGNYQYEVACERGVTIGANIEYGQCFSPCSWRVSFFKANAKCELDFVLNYRLRRFGDSIGSLWDGDDGRDFFFVVLMWSVMRSVNPIFVISGLKIFWNPVKKIFDSRLVDHWNQIFTFMEIHIVLKFIIWEYLRKNEAITSKIFLLFVL